MKKKSLINEVRKMQKTAGLLKEDYQKPTEDHVKRYWETMIEVQPEVVLRSLVSLTTGTMSFDDFIASTSEDIFDSYRDELYSNED